MKKTFALLLAVIMLLLCLSGCGKTDENLETSDVGSSLSDGKNTETEIAGTASSSGIDFEKLYASHKPDELVMTVNGQEVLWEEYFYWLFTNVDRISSYFDSIKSYYGYSISWEDTAGEDGSNYYDLALSTVETSLLQVYSIFGFAEENGVELDEDALAELEALLKSDITSLCGEDATEEDFNEALKLAYMNREIYDQIQQANYLYQNGFATLYGENGAHVETEDALAYLEEMEYMCANHILFLTQDMDTGEAFDEATVSAKLAEAEKLADELQAISEPEELVKKFTELKAEFCEDSGKVMYPDGYTFTTGKMVAEFENAVQELNEYEVSEPVTTTYGYHIIVKLPLDPDMPIEYSSAGTPITARAMMANDAYGIVMQAYMDDMQFEYAESFKPIALNDYISDAE